MLTANTIVQQNGSPVWRSILTVLLAAAGIAVMVYYNLCDTDCSYLKGELLGIDLKYLGIGFMAVLIVLVMVRQSWLIRIMLAGALGGEIHLIAFQAREDVFCPFCLAFAAILLISYAVQYERPAGGSNAFRKILYLPGEVVMPFLKNLRLPLIGFVLAGYLVMISLFSGSVTPAYGAEGSPVPSFGKGNVEVLVFTDYFCPPCQAVEKDLEPALEEVLKKGKAMVTFVDMPIHAQTPLYAKYFLYAVRAGKDYREAMQARHQLFDLAKGSAPGSDADLTGALQARHVRLAPHDVKPTLQAWDGIIRHYRITSTPTMVVRYSDTDVRTYRGSMEIRNGLESLRKALAPKKAPRKARRARA
ncbi:MAG: thioredoxin domain-containing protein [Syntrophaceae bacterium]|nr:thioredoxin domain-containing protein [Syntrophaceae bacterium]